MKKDTSNGQSTNLVSGDVLAPATIPVSGMPWLTSAGCRWSEVNWSCAYDSIFMSLYGIYATATSQFQQDFCFASLLANTLDHAFKRLLEPPLCTTAMFDHYRDKFRDELSFRYPGRFRRFGQCGASVSAILDILFPPSGRQLMIIPHCPNGCNVSIHLAADAGISSVVVPSELVRNSVSTLIPVNLNEYISNFLYLASQDLRLINMTCNECDIGLLSFSPSFVDAPPIIFFEIPMEAGSSLSQVLGILKCHRLCKIVCISSLLSFI